MPLTPVPALSPALLATFARMAGLPPLLVALIETAEGPAMTAFTSLIGRAMAGEPIEDIVAAHAPDPVKALDEVDAERGG